MNNSPSPGNNTVDKFVTYLEQKGLIASLELSDEDIADTLWLALKMGAVKKDQPEGTPSTSVNTSQSQEDNNRTDNYNSGVADFGYDFYLLAIAKLLHGQYFRLLDLYFHTLIQQRHNSQERESLNLYKQHKFPLTGQKETNPNIEGLPFKTPDAPAILNKSAIIRALRPLKRKVPSSTRNILDVEATVTRIVEQDIWQVVNTPEPEKWLDLELIVEENTSSFLWRQTIDELEAILHNFGAFRRFRTWTLYYPETSENSEIKKYPILTRRKKGSQKNSSQHSYRELISNTGRTLIILVSDCISSIWQQENIYQWLRNLSKQESTTIIQFFPERLWLNTKLGLGYKVIFTASSRENKYTVTPNSKLTCSEDLDIETSLNLPIITPEPEYFQPWAKAIAGYKSSQIPGIVLDMEFVQEQTKETPQIDSQNTETTPAEITKEEQIKAAEIIVDQFLATASPTAKRLAGLMAAVPVSLPVVRLIQNTMLPESTPVNVAEIFFSGMIERNENEYDFVKGVRKLLNQSMPLPETEKLLDVISEYIAKNISSSIKTFTALLLNLDNILDRKPDKQETLLPFAEIALEVLKNLGGEYATFANNIKTNQQDKKQKFFQQFAGNYICAIKENDIWQEQLGNLLIPTYLLISPQGEVKFGSHIQDGFVTIQNLTVKGQTLSWTSDSSNKSAASITFKENSEDSKLFEGWLKYPNEDIQKDFRGRLDETLPPPFLEFFFEVATITITNLQPFEFEVATIEPKQTGGWFGFGQKTELIVKPRRQQSQYFIENLENRVQLEMVEIPGGSFQMGAPQTEKDSSNSERPQHQVNVPTFFMGKYPITQAQWKAVAALPQINRELQSNPSNFKGANRPVEQVSWYDAVEFCDRLSQYTGKTYRLPSEAEWEYACRAGTNTPFHFGETITTDLANYDGNQTYGQGSKGEYREKTTEVGSFKVANNFGLYDMHGNVWEWCLDDWHDNYQGAPTDGSAWFNSDDKLSDKSRYAVLRGGSWFYLPKYCRSASRFNNRVERDNYNVSIGFRVVCAVGRILQ
jgi:formylglycine-generating enzyme required for sulfatase activity